MKKIKKFMKRLIKEDKSNLNIKYLEKLSNNLRKEIIDISYKKKAHHIGSELSCIDILAVLYFSIMNIKPSNKYKLSRDFFLLSKGHAALSLYVTLCKKKFFSKKFLYKEFLSNGGKLGGHPDLNTSLGIDFSSGSLGHGLSIGCGIALSKKKDKIPGNVYVLLGDGECNEGMIWESIMFASSFKLNNLTAIIDYNNLQGLDFSNKIINLKPLDKKLKSFGWEVYIVDGHNISSLIKTFKNKNKKPKAIIAKTIKGKGLISMENKLSSHYVKIDTKSQYEQLIKELK